MKEIAVVFEIFVSELTTKPIVTSVPWADLQGDPGDLRKPFSEHRTNNWWGLGQLLAG
jgi:hypothetical protein